MARSKIVGLLFESWKDLDRVVDGLSVQDALRNFDGGSSFAWTYAHVANQVDTWINARFQQLQPHVLIGQRRFRFGGTGKADDWEAIQPAVQEVRTAARSYLQDMDDARLEHKTAYQGSSEILREKGLTVRYAIMRGISHHYFHIGEIASKRDRVGHSVGNYPGKLEESI
jgi:hypothetical protein